MTSSIYIIGPMTGLPHFNFPAFDAARDALLRLGWQRVVSPADLDRSVGFDAMTLPDWFDWATWPEGLDRRECVKRDLAAMLDCDAVLVMPGWTCSEGAPVEIEVARWAGLRRHYLLFRGYPTP